MAEGEKSGLRAAVMPKFMSGLPTRIEGYRRRAEDARSGPLRRTAATGDSPACHVLLHRYLSLAGPSFPGPGSVCSGAFPLFMRHAPRLRSVCRSLRHDNLHSSPQAAMRIE